MGISTSRNRRWGRVMRRRGAEKGPGVEQKQEQGPGKEKADEQVSSC
jgi:hypothetical protein